MPSKQTRHFSSIALSSTAKLAAVLMLLLPPSSVVAGVVECYFAANTTHITELPKTLTCSCQDGGGGGDDSLSLAEDVFGKFSRNLLRNLETVNVQNCQRLTLNLSSVHHDTNNNDDDGETKFGRVDVLVRNVSLLRLGIEYNTRDFVENLRLEQVDRVETTFLERPAFVVNANATGNASATTPGPTDAEEMYLLVIYGLCAGLLATLAVVFTLGVCLCRGGCGCCCAGRTKGKRRGHCCLRRSKRVSRAESWRYESNIYVNPRGRQREQQQQVKGPGFTASALKASLPYQLVPLSEAAAITQRNSRQVTQPASPQFGEQRPPTASTFAGGAGGYNTHGTNYTDSSLQYADDTDFDDDGAAAHQQQEAMAGSFDQRSTANSGSYGSRNQTSTLPMQQQQQLQQQQQQEPNYSRPLQ